MLVDGVGEWYSRPRVGRLLKRRGVPFERFLPPQILPPRAHINLRNHRKILLVDGRVGYTGGMNLDRRHLPGPDGKPRVRDIHFELAGPVLRQLERIFIEDWEFAAGERLPDSAPAETAGAMLCRTIPDGPSRDIDRLIMVLLGTLSVARHTISIVTPYFIPSRELLASLQAAALRGVDVKLILPENNNLPYVHWASRNYLWQLLERGVKVFYQQGSFVHSKLYLVDDEYTQIGSANWDPRSLRLNFEVAVEVIDRDFASRIAAQIDRYLEGSRPVTLEEVDGRPLPERVRDSLAWLASPYL